MLATGIVPCLDFQKEIVRHHIKNTIVIFNPFFINFIFNFFRHWRFVPSLEERTVCCLRKYSLISLF